MSQFYRTNRSTAWALLTRVHYSILGRLKRTQLDMALVVSGIQSARGRCITLISAFVTVFATAACTTSRGATRSPIPLIATREALNIGQFITDAWLNGAKRAACTRGQIAPLYGLRVLATQLPDGSLLRARGSVGGDTTRTALPRVVTAPGAYFEIVRDWPGGGGIRVGTFDGSSDTFSVLRYGGPRDARLNDDRPVTDAETASILAILQRQFATLDCALRLNRKVDFAELVPLWERETRDGWEWRDDWPRRPLGRR